MSFPKGQPISLGGAVILTAAETARLRAAMPADWSDPRFDELLDGNALEPDDVYSLFDSDVREAVEEARVVRSERHLGTSLVAEELVELALERIVQAFPGVIEDLLGPPDPLANAVGPIAVALGQVQLWAECLAGHAGLSEALIARIDAHPTEWVPEEPEEEPDAATALAGLLEARQHALAMAMEAIQSALEEAGGTEVADALEPVEGDAAADDLNDTATDLRARRLAHERIYEAVDAALEVAREEFEAQLSALEGKAVTPSDGEIASDEESHGT